MDPIITLSRIAIRSIMALLDELRQEERIVMDKLLTVNDAAVRAGVCTHTIRAWLRAGLPAQKIGRDWLIDPADLEAFPRPKRGRPRRKGG